MSFAEIITNTVAVCRAAGFREADNRRPIEEQPQAGADRCFHVTAQPVADVFPRLGISDSVRTATVTVRLAYFMGGGDAGGQAHGGNRLAVKCRAYEDCKSLLFALENPENYDSQVTGIQRITSPTGWREAFEANKASVWDLVLQVQWEQVEDARAVA